MNTTLTLVPPLQTCRTQHRYWATELAQREDDIDELMGLLAELPPPTYRSFSDYTVDHIRLLSQLKARIQGLLTEVVCSGESCVSVKASATTCPNPHFTQSPFSGNTLIANASEECRQLKDHCQRFLDELMHLNLI